MSTRDDHDDVDLETDQTGLLHASNSVKSNICLKLIIGFLFTSTVVLGVFLGLVTMKSSDTSDNSLYEPACRVEGAADAVPSIGIYKSARDKFLEQFPKLGYTFDETTLIYLEGGHIQTQYYADTELFFRQESNFLYLSGYEKAEALLVLLHNTSGDYSLLFVLEPTTQYAVWNGVPQTIPELQARYEVDDIYYTSQFVQVVGPLNASVIYTLPNVDLNTSIINGTFAGATQNAVLESLLANSRAYKSKQEMDLMTFATDVSAAAHINVMQLASRGVFNYEYQIALRFKEVSEGCGGWPNQAYLPIVGAGPRSAILHYNTNYLPVQKDDMVLLDAGAEFFGYASDITRTWPVSGKFTSRQATLYNIVLNAQNAALAYYMPGLPIGNASRAATSELLQGLLDAGLVKGNLQELIANSIASIFMPHGLGHFVGLDVHDPGQYPQYLTPSQTLAASMVLTCEPGLYFIPQLLDAAYSNAQKSPYLNPDIIKEFMSEPGVGGIRIEDVVLITETGYKILSSAVPKTIEEIESIMEL